MYRNSILMISLIALLFTACKKDENDDSCIQSDFLGSYSGMNQCEGDDAEAVTFTIFEDGGELIMKDNEGQELPIDVNGCTFSIPTIDVIFAKVSGTGTLNGNKLTITQNLSVFGITTKCTFEGTK